MLQNIKKLLADNALWIAIVVTISIAILSLTSVPKIDLGLNIKSTDKYLHILAYCTLSFFWHLALRKKLQNKRYYIAIITSIIVYGIILEGLQGGLTSYRTADWYDVIANTIGVFLAIILFHTATKWFSTK